MKLENLSKRIENGLLSKNIPELVAHEVSTLVGEQIEDECGGLTLYVSKKRIKKANLKREAIYQEFTGQNHKQLAKKHQVSVVHIYRLLREREAARKEALT